MKLSDAIVAGTMLSDLRGNDINHCALGVAGTAVGIPLQKISSVRCYRYESIIGFWPWLARNNEEHAQIIMDLLQNIQKRWPAIVK